MSIDSWNKVLDYLSGEKKKHKKIFKNRIKKKAKMKYSIIVLAALVGMALAIPAQHNAVNAKEKIE